MAPWSSLPFELKSQIIKAYVDAVIDTLTQTDLEQLDIDVQADGFKLEIEQYCIGACDINTCITLRFEFRKTPNPEGAIETGFSDLYHHILPKDLQIELVGIMMRRLEASWAHSVQLPALHATRRGLYIIMLLLWIGVKDTSMFTTSRVRFPPGIAIALDRKQPCPVHPVYDYADRSTRLISWRHCDQSLSRLK